jgi:thiamine-monophosphate kinase
MSLVSEIGEFGLIERLRALDVVQGIGDDCAVVAPPPDHDLVMTADALVEDVHFRHVWTGWRDLGYKSMAVNLSDIAAMGAAPLGILVTLGLRSDTESTSVLELYEGAAEALRPLGAVIVGGDMVASPTATVVSVTAYGSLPRGTAATRAGALAGDAVWVTGSLGDSAGGLRLLRGGTGDFPELVTRHNRPTPRVLEARQLIRTGAVHAMMDVSDGLAGDLGHLCRMSGLGATIDEPALPYSAELRAASKHFDWDPLALALHGGEDYELLFTTHPSLAPPSLDGCRVTRVAVMEPAPGLRLRRRDGTVVSLDARGFQHF